MPLAPGLPAFAGAANARRITLSMIDASGDNYSESLYVAPTATDVEVQAYIDAYGAATQAVVYEVSDVFVYAVDGDPDDAGLDQRNSIKDGVNISLKDSSAPPPNTIAARLVAPIEAVMQGNQDIPLASAAQMTALFAAIIALRPTYDVQSVQYTERRERTNNPKVKV